MRFDVPPTKSDENIKFVSGVPGREDLKTVGDEKLINDNIISFGLWRIGRQSSQHAFFFNSHLVERLSSGDLCEKWLKKVNICTYKYIIVPIHDPFKRHWRIALLWRTEPNNFSITILDSMYPKTNCPAVLSEFFSRCGIHLSPKPSPENLPLQVDGYNCGIFILKYAELFLANPVGFKRCVETRTMLEWEINEVEARKQLRAAAAEMIAAPAEDPRMATIIQSLRSDTRLLDIFDRLGTDKMFLEIVTRLQTDEDFFDRLTAIASCESNEHGALELKRKRSASVEIYKSVRRTQTSYDD